MCAVGPPPEGTPSPALSRPADPLQPASHASILPHPPSPILFAITPGFSVAFFLLSLAHTHGQVGRQELGWCPVVFKVKGFHTVRVMNSVRV